MFGFNIIKRMFGLKYYNSTLVFVIIIFVIYFKFSLYENN